MSSNHVQVLSKLEDAKDTVQYSNPAGADPALSPGSLWETPGVVLKAIWWSHGRKRKSKTRIDGSLLCYRLLPRSPKGYKSSLVDSCKSSSVLLVSPLVLIL